MLNRPTFGGHIKRRSSFSFQVKNCKFGYRQELRHNGLSNNQNMGRHQERPQMDCNSIPRHHSDRVAVLSWIIMLLPLY